MAGYAGGTNDVPKGYFGMLSRNTGEEFVFNKNDKVLSNNVLTNAMDRAGLQDEEEDILKKKIHIDPLKDKPVIDLSKGKHIIINEGVVRSTKKK